MKTHIFKIVTVLSVVAFSLTSCSVDDYTIQGRSTKETLTQNEASARSALAGIYQVIRPNSSNGYIYSTMAITIAGPEQQPVFSPEPSDLQADVTTFYKNDVKAVPATRRSGGLLTFYRKSYEAINLANFFIETIEEKGINGASALTKNQILAEAKALRAHTYFQLLRVFGQFYNPDSEYGIITTTKVITNSTYLKRNKVSETYDLMIKDLEFAIENVASGNKRYFVTQEYAKGLLAKVYLYKGGVENWSKTVSYCKDIIDNLGGKFKLVSNYADIFAKGIESSEFIFTPYYNKEKDQILGSEEQLIINDQNLRPSNSFTSLAQNDPRYKFTFGQFTANNSTFAYNKYPKSDSAFPFLRVAEVYLMYAEAVARTDGNMQEALNALNTVRKRVFSSTDSDDSDGDGDGSVGFKPSKNSSKVSNTYIFVDKATLLEDIRKEKMLELHIENGQSWFDLVRYHQLGDVNATTLKPTITNVNQLIFPIPLRVIKNNPKFGPQNPGY